MCDILVKNGLIVTVDDEKRIIRDGAIAIQGNEIIAVGKTRNLSAEYNAVNVIDARDKLVLPGLIDAHLHSDQGIMRGIADDVVLEKWIHELVLPFEAAMKAEDVYISALLSYVEMIKSGTTCFAEAGSHPLYIDEVGRAMEKIGIRGRIGLHSYDTSSTEFPIPKQLLARSVDEAVRRNEDMIRRWDGASDGKIMGEVIVVHPTTGSGELYRRSKDLADRYETILHTHLAVNEEDEHSMQQLYGLPPVQYLESLGVLDNNVLLVHMNHICNDDIDILKKRDVKICHNPSAALHGGYGAVHSKILEILEAGITVALGCDGAPASNFLDIVREMYLVSTMQKDMRRNATIMPPEVALEMATINGAKALKLEREVGSIKPGKKADLAIFNLRKPEWTPIFNIVSNLVYSAHGGSVETVIIDGKVVMENRLLTNVFEEEILCEAQRAAERVAERINLKAGSYWKIV